ncbi:MAG: LPS export ABC transporter ATP-binding protein, partial [Planctomycetes bacterium]|nr:LPS export ABC transporter ATP-binding protein [Planctomycetota bacterium]
MLRVDQLSVRIQGRPILEDVSLDVERGQAIGLLGPNGAGKTTCFRTILGQLRPDRGTVILDGKAIVDAPLHVRARMGIGYLPQEASVFRGLTVADNITAVLQLRKSLSRSERKAELERVMGDLQIDRIRSTRGAHLSGGERRRVEIARALAANPRYILLDEPFAGVDPVSVGEIQNLVGQLT